ncbi:MAG: hypothetical protein WD250_17915 [Egibacteraceae bacterium]
MVPWAVFATLILALLGPSLIGDEVVLPHDQLEAFLPWSEGEPIPTRQLANYELRDVIDQYYPTQHAILRRLLAGDDAAWLGDVGIGYPGEAFLGWGVWSPFQLPAAVLPFDQAWSWGMALRLLAAMGGAYVLARGFGIGRAGSTVAGVAFGLSGFMVGWLGWPQSHVGAFIPWVWAAVRVCARPGRPWWAVAALGLATAGLWLGGFPAVSVWGLLGAAVLGAHALLSHRGAGWRTLVGGGAAIAGGVVAGTALAAFTLLPTVLMLDQFDLGSREQMWRARVPLAALVTFAVPGYFGDVVSRPFWLRPAYVETVGYAGVVTLALAVPAWVLAPRRLGVWVATGLAAAFVAVAYGAPFVRPVLAGVPVLATNPPPRALAVAGLSLALLGAFGADALVRWVGGWSRLTRWTFVRAAVVALLGAAAWTAMRPLPWLTAYAQDAFASPAAAAQALRLGWEHVEVAAGLVVAVAMLVAGARLVAVAWRPLGAGILAVGLVGLVAVDLGGFAAGRNPQVPRAGLFPDAPGLDALVDASARHRVATANDVGLPNTHLEYGFADVRYHGFVSRRHRQVLTRMGAQFTSATLWRLDAEDSAAWEPWLTLLGVGTVLAPDWVEVLPGARVPAVGYVPSGPLSSAGVAVRLPAPRDGTIVGVQVRVGDFGRRNVGALQARVQVGDVATAGRIGLASLVDGKPAMIPVPPVEVSAGDQVSIRLTGDVQDGTSGVAVYGDATDTGFRPAVGLRFRDDPTYEATEAGPVRLFANDRAPERVYAVGSARAVLPGRALGVLEDLEPEEVATTAVVEATAGAPLTGLPDGGTPVVTGWTQDGGTIRAVVDADDGAVLVVLQEALDGWRATLEGQPVDVVRVNHLFVGVVVPPGGGVVELRYVPAGWSVGVALAAAAALSLLVGSAWGVWRRRRARGRLTSAPP